MNYQSIPLSQLLTEYKELNTESLYRPVAVGRYGIRTRESIYKKELSKDYSKNKVIEKDTLTIGMGSKQIDVGILSENNRYSVSPAYHTFRISSVDSDYLRYCLEYRNQDMSERYMIASARQGKTIDFKRWLTYQIPVYDKDAQLDIVYELDTIHETIDKLSENLNSFDELIKSRFIEMFEEKDFLLAPIRDFVDLNITSSKKQYGSDGLINYIDISSIDNERNEITKGTEYVLSEAPSRAQQAIKKYDILISTVRPNLRNIAIVKFDDNNLVGSSGFCVLRAYKCNPYYLMTCVLTDKFTHDMTLLTNGATYPAIKDDNVLDYKIINAPIELQNEFADFVKLIDKSKFSVQKEIDLYQELLDKKMDEYFG